MHWLEVLFDKNFSLDKEGMVQNIWREAMQFGIGNVLGISTGTRHTDRARIGVRIREIREERGMEARDLAKLAGIDAANLSRIENGKYSVGLDILAKIATALGKGGFRGFVSLNLMEKEFRREQHYAVSP